jgi:hypothetical protein
MLNHSLRFVVFLLTFCAAAQAQDKLTLLVPERVFDGERMRADWVVVTAANKIR